MPAGGGTFLVRREPFEHSCALSTFQNDDNPGPGPSGSATRRYLARPPTAARVIVVDRRRRRPSGRYARASSFAVANGPAQRRTRSASAAFRLACETAVRARCV